MPECNSQRRGTARTYLIYVVNCVVVLFCYCVVVNYVVLCIVCVYMCTVLLPPGVNPFAVNKYIMYI